MKSKVERITPEKASEMLEMNTANFRRPDRRRVQELAKIMSQGGWELNGESIKFGIDGTLLDGQHRLMACVQSGKDFETLVVRGVAATAMGIDRGRPRNVGQWLQHIGVPNSRGIAAIVRNAVCHDRGHWADASWSHVEYTDADLVEYEKAHRDELQEARRMASRSLSLGGCSIIGTVLHIGTRGCKDLAVAEWFSEALATGQGLSDTDAVLHFRNRIL